MNNGLVLSNQSNLLKLYQFFEKYGTVHIFNRNEFLWGGNGSHSNNIYYVKYGLVKVVTQDSSNEDLIHVIYSNGNIFPILTLVNINIDNRYYVALNKVKVYSVTASSFQENIANNTELAFGALQCALNNSGLYDSAIVNLQYSKVSERLVNALLTLGSRFGRKYEDCLVLDKVFNHRLIASQVNTTRESVSREMYKLRKRGLIDTNGRCIILKDINGLCAEIHRPVAPEFANIFSEQ